jgi:hypothetical protein
MPFRKVLSCSTLSLLSSKSLVVIKKGLLNRNTLTVLHKLVVFLKDFIALWKEDVAFVIFIDVRCGLTKRMKKGTGWKFRELKLRDTVGDPASFMNSPTFACVIQIKRLPVMSVIHLLWDVVVI